MDGGTQVSDVSDGPDEDEGDNEQDGSFSEDGGYGLENTLNGDALARKMVDTQMSNELGLVRSEVQRLRGKVKRIEREKEDMADDFRNTTKVLLNRIKELEAEVSGNLLNRPTTSGIIEHIEGRSSTASRSLRTPMHQSRPGTGVGGLGGSPQVLRIAEDEVLPGSPPKPARLPTDVSAADAEPGTSLCGNCRRNIPAGNVLAHSVSCYRNNYFCDACEEAIPLRDKDGHVEEWTGAARLIDALSSRDVDTVQKMLEHGADLGSAVHPVTGDAAMHAAARFGDAELVAFCCGHGTDINPVNGQGETPLHLATAAAPPDVSGAGPSSAVRLLIELGANLNALDTKGESALLTLCRRGVAGTAKYLVEMRADTEVRTNLGDTPLQVAQRAGHQETVLALVTGGAALRPGTPSRSNTPNPPAPVSSPEVGRSREMDGDGHRTRSGSSPSRGGQHRTRSSGAPQPRAIGSPPLPGSSGAPRPTDAGGYPPRPRIRRSNSVRGASRGGGDGSAALGAASAVADATRRADRQLT